MNILLLGIVGVFVALLGYFIFKKFIDHKQLARTHVVDAKAQEAYTHNKQHNEEEKVLTLKEKIELSWQFLKNVKEQIFSRFSQDDQRKLHEIGDILLGYGMKYKHDIELEVKQQVVPSKSITLEKDKDQGQSASL